MKVCQEINSADCFKLSDNWLLLFFFNEEAVLAFDYNVSLYEISLLWNRLRFFRQVLRISNNSKSDKNNSIKKCKQGFSSIQLSKKLTMNWNQLPSVHSTSVE